MAACSQTTVSSGSTALGLRIGGLLKIILLLNRIYLLNTTGSHVCIHRSSDRLASSSLMRSKMPRKHLLIALSWRWRHTCVFYWSEFIDPELVGDWTRWFHGYGPCTLWFVCNFCPVACQLGSLWYGKCSNPKWGKRRKIIHVGNLTSCSFIRFIRETAGEKLAKLKTISSEITVVDLSDFLRGVLGSQRFCIALHHVVWHIEQAGHCSMNAKPYSTLLWDALQQCAQYLYSYRSWADGHIEASSVRARHGEWVACWLKCCEMRNVTLSSRKNIMKFRPDWLRQRRRERKKANTRSNHAIQEPGSWNLFKALDWLRLKTSIYLFYNII